MFESKCLLLCLCFFVSSHATGNLVPFIDKCEWSDKACLVKSTQKAILPFCKGLPELGVPPMDPLEVSQVDLNEGELKVTFADMVVTGASKVKILKVERDIKKNALKIVGECPIEVVGQYDASGKLLFTPIQGKGEFRVNCQLIHLEVDVDLQSVVGPDGIKYWKIGKASHSYEAKEKCTFDFKNLFNGDKEKAEPIATIFNSSWQEIIHSLGKPLVKGIISKIVDNVQTFCTKVPADQLEI